MVEAPVAFPGQPEATHRPSRVLPRLCSSLSLVSPRFSGVFENGVARLFGDHVDRTYNEEAGYLGENRGVNHPQPGRTPDPEPAVKNRHLVIRPADPAGAAGVVAPGAVLRELSQGSV